MRSCTVIAGRLSWRIKKHWPHHWVVTRKKKVPTSGSSWELRAPVEQRNKISIKHQFKGSCNKIQHVINMYQHVLICISKSKWQWCLAHSQHMYERVDVFPKHPSSAWDQRFTSISHEQIPPHCKACDPSPWRNYSEVPCLKVIHPFESYMKNILIVFLCFVGSVYDKVLFLMLKKIPGKASGDLLQKFPMTLSHPRGLQPPCSLAGKPWPEGHEVGKERSHTTNFRVETWCHNAIR